MSSSGAKAHGSPASRRDGAGASPSRSAGLGYDGRASPLSFDGSGGEEAHADLMLLKVCAALSASKRPRTVSSWHRSHQCSPRAAVVIRGVRLPIIVPRWC